MCSCKLMDTSVLNEWRIWRIALVWSSATHIDISYCYSCSTRKLFTCALVMFDFCAFIFGVCAWKVVNLFANVNIVLNNKYESCNIDEVKCVVVIVVVVVVVDGSIFMLWIYAMPWTDMALMKWEDGAILETLVEEKNTVTSAKYCSTLKYQNLISKRIALNRIVSKRIELKCIQRNLIKGNWVKLNRVNNKIVFKTLSTQRKKLWKVAGFLQKEILLRQTTTWIEGLAFIRVNGNKSLFWRRILLKLLAEGCGKHTI